MYCPNRTCNVSLVKTQNQIDAAAAQRASALLLYLRDARRAEALVATRHKRMLGGTVEWGVYAIQQTSSKLPANVFKIHVLLLDVCWIV